jgi:PEP-CTERM motif
MTFSSVRKRMNIARKAALGIFAFAALAALWTPTANAAAFLWSYTGLNGYSVSASGTLLATPLGGGTYQVTSISGSRNGTPITGLTTYAFEDQLVYLGFPQLDYPGLAFTDLSGNAFNAFYDTSTTDAYNCGFVGYCEIGPGVPGTSGLGPPRDPVNPISFTLTAVPEPATWTIILLGLALTGVCRRLRGAVGA